MTAHNDSPATKGDKPAITNDKKAPSSRIGRLVRLGKLAPKAMPVAIEGAKKALGVKRSEEQERLARQRTYEDAKRAGKALLKTLGEMKGLPMKVGQMFSYIDGLAPPGYEDKVKRTLAMLQQKAPALSPEAAREVIIEQLGAPPERIFAHWQTEPFAAASLGQVHRATTLHGELVAVKVQYPGIDTAMRNDLKSLAVLEKVLAPLARPYQSKQTLQEITRVFLEELDYGLEAERTEMFRVMFRDRPEIIIPKVHHSLSAKKVLTTEYMQGATYDQFARNATQQQRNEAGKAIWTFMMRSLLVHGVLYADPHPGNYRFFDDGTVAFLDFGCIKILPPAMAQRLKDYLRAAMDEDWETFDYLLEHMVGVDRSDENVWQLYRRYTLQLLRPITTKGIYRSSPEEAKQAVQFLVRGQRSLIKEAEGGPKLPPPVKIPFDLTFVNRLQWGLASIMGGLYVEAPLRDMVEPWIRSPLVSPFDTASSPQAGSSATERGR